MFFVNIHLSKPFHFNSNQDYSIHTKHSLLHRSGSKPPLKRTNWGRRLISFDFAHRDESGYNYNQGLFHKMTQGYSGLWDLYQLAYITSTYALYYQNKFEFGTFFGNSKWNTKSCSFLAQICSALTPDLLLFYKSIRKTPPYKVSVKDLGNHHVYQLKYSSCGTLRSEPPLLRWMRPVEQNTLWLWEGKC